MKKIVFVAAVAALSACSQQNEETPAPEPTEATDAAPTATDGAALSMAVDGKPDAGNFEMTGPDGTVIKLTMNADGTMTNEVAGNITKGTWTKTEPATYCMTWEGDTANKCYFDVMDGTTWRSTNQADPKDTYTVVRVD